MTDIRRVGDSGKHLLLNEEDTRHNSNTRHVGCSGAHTVEGNVSGSRAARLTREREKQRQEYEAGKNKIKQQNQAASLARINDNFVSSSSTTVTSSQQAKHTGQPLCVSLLVLLSLVMRCDVCRGSGERGAAAA